MKVAVLFTLSCASGVLSFPTRKDVECGSLDHMNFFKRDECAEFFKRGKSVPSDLDALLSVTVKRRQDICEVIPVCDDEEFGHSKKIRRQDICDVIPVCDEEGFSDPEKIRRAVESAT